MNSLSVELPVGERGKLFLETDKCRNLAVNEVYLDGELKKAEQINENERSYGIFIHSLILSNSAKVVKVNDKDYRVIGDDVEKALSYYTISKGFDKNLIDSIAPKISELSVVDDNKLKTTTHIINGKARIISKGPPDELLKKCSYVIIDSKVVKLTRRLFRDINYAFKYMVNRGMRVYALAIKDFVEISEAINFEASTKNLTFLALVGIGDS